MNSKGELYTWGKSKDNVLGHKDYRTTNVSLPVKVDSLQNEKIISMSCGNTHMVAINDKGEVFAWGNVDHGKLGFIPLQEQEKSLRGHYQTSHQLKSGVQPQKIENIPKMVQSSCGSQHTLLLSADGAVYGMGQNKKGVLAQKKSVPEVLTP